MKRVLVTGASGAIGLEVIKYLLSEGKYEITALDLRNRHSINSLKKYKKRVNVVLGDITDRILIEALVKDHDIIIHLAGVLPPIANISQKVAYQEDFIGCENIVRAISYYHPEAHLFYASSMSLYEGKQKASIKTTIKISDGNYYNKAKLDSEELIKEKLKNYTIYRLPLVLSSIKYDNFPLNGKLNERIEYITKEDAAYAFVKGIDKLKVLNKKIFNVTSDKRILYKDLIKNILEIHGISCKLILHRLFKTENFYNSLCTDGNELNDILEYRNDNLEDYYNRMKDDSKKRVIRRFLAKPFVRGLKK